MGLQFLSLKRSKTPCAEVLSTTCGMWNGTSHIAQKIHQNSPTFFLKPNNPRPHPPPQKKQKTKNIQNHHQAQNVTLPRTSPPKKNSSTHGFYPNKKKTSSNLSPTSASLDPTKPTIPVRPWDEFRPYRLGGPLRNPSDVPMSPLGLAPPYDAIGPAVQAISAHIHCAVLCYLVEELGDWKMEV